MSEISEPQARIEACLDGEPFAWEQFVDQFLPTVAQTIVRLDVEHSLGLSTQRKEQVAIEVFRQIHENEYALLRELEQPAGFQTMLTVLTYRSLMTALDKGGS